MGDLEALEGASSATIHRDGDRDSRSLGGTEIINNDEKYVEGPSLVLGLFCLRFRIHHHSLGSNPDVRCDRASAPASRFDGAPENMLLWPHLGEMTGMQTESTTGSHSRLGWSVSCRLAGRRCSPASPLMPATFLKPSQRIGSSPQRISCGHSPVAS
jgi:hypothetical protein